MLTNILEFFRGKKNTFVKQSTIKEDYVSSLPNTSSGTYWPSQLHETVVQEIDWEAFEQAMKELEESFQEGGSNAHRNPMVKS